MHALACQENPLKLFSIITALPLYTLLKAITIYLSENIKALQGRIHNKKEIWFYVHWRNSFDNRFYIFSCGICDYYIFSKFHIITQLKWITKRNGWYISPFETHERSWVIISKIMVSVIINCHSLSEQKLLAINS